MTSPQTRTIHGDCREVLPTLPAQSAHCCVTSPPYFGLRNYGHSDQIGLESTPDEFVAELVKVFREVRRVLRDDGTLWLNLGDSYMAKQLLGMPWRVAFALQADGWYLRQDIIWAKPNPMPESVTDRCTKAHEYIFLLSKSAKYHYDADAVKEPATDPETIRGKTRPGIDALYSDTRSKQFGQYRSNLHSQAPMESRNRRSVWTVTTQSYSGAHFATFPPKLIEPCVIAGCPPGGTVLDPFAGTGTTLQVALANARSGIGIELVPDYVELAERRMDGAQIGLNL